MPPRGLPTDPSKLLPPILRNLQSSPPDTYSAHQKARTTAARLVHSDHQDAAVEVLFGSAKELLKLGEWGSGCDLAVYLCQTYLGMGKEVNAESKARITQLLALLTGQGAWRKKVADLAIKWTSECGPCSTGDPDLHQYIGGLYYKDRAFAQAETHLVASCKRDAAVTLAEMMFEWCEQGKSDPGPYACRAVLPYLSILPPAILPAESFLTTFIHLLSSVSPSFITTTSSDPSTDKSIPLTTSPTLNFLSLALATIQRAPKEGTSGVQARGMNGGVGREWEGLVRRYKNTGGALADQAVQEAILHISTTIFLIPPPRGAGGGADMLQNLMGMFGGAGMGGAGGAPRVGGR